MSRECFPLYVIFLLIFSQLFSELSVSKTNLIKSKLGSFKVLRANLNCWGRLFTSIISLKAWISFIYNRIEMQLNKYSTKKIKTISSLDTQITQSEIPQHQIKINLRSPKKRKQQQQKTEREQFQIIGIPQQDQIIRSSRQTNKNLLKVPQIVLKKQNSLFDTQNFEAMLQSRNQEEMRMMMRNTDVMQGSASREINETSHLMMTNSTVRQSKNKPNQQQRPTQMQKKMKEQPRIVDSIQKQILEDIFQQNQDQKKKLLRNNSLFTNFNQKPPQIGNQQMLSQRKSTKGCEIVIKEGVGSPTKQIQIKDREKIVKKEPPKAPKMDNEIVYKKPKQGRLKLSDYLFKTQVSSAKALLQKKQRLKQQKQAEQRRGSEKPTKQPIAKYNMPNCDVGQIVRAQINSELDKGIAYLNTLRDLINSTEMKSGTTEGELVQVFRVRSALQEEVNKKLNEIVKQYARYQVSAKQKTTNFYKQKEGLIRI